MTYATIDVGTNSVRLLICSYSGQEISNSEKRIEMTRLGQGVNETRTLAPERMEDTLNVIKKFVKYAQGKGVQKIWLMATSAVRDAKNGPEFSARVEESVGYPLEIITGELEAQLGFSGAMMGKKSSQKALIIDIGGGSTELIVGCDSGIEKAISIDVGAVRMTDQFVENDPITLKEKAKIQQHVRQLLSQQAQPLKSLQPETAVAIGGTASTLVTMNLEMDNYASEKVHNQEIKNSDISKIEELLTGLKNEERVLLKGLEPKRADIILAGVLIMQEVLNFFDIASFSFSDYDNLEGFLIRKGTVPFTSL